MNEPMATRLAVAYQTASDESLHEGEAWYPAARAIARGLARRNGITLSQAAGIIASASLNQSWKGNLTLAERIASGDIAGLTTVRRECAAILSGEQPTRAIGGPKRVQFYRAIMGDPDALAIDRWAARAAGAEGLLPRKGGYQKIADAYHRAAQLFNIAPRDLQAVVWCEIRGSAS